MSGDANKPKSEYQLIGPAEDGKINVSLPKTSSSDPHDARPGVDEVFEKDKGDDYGRLVLFGLLQRSAGSTGQTTGPLSGYEKTEGAVGDGRTQVQGARLG